MSKVSVISANPPLPDSSRPEASHLHLNVYEAMCGRS